MQNGYLGKSIEHKTDNIRQTNQEIVYDFCLKGKSLFQSKSVFHPIIYANK